MTEFGHELGLEVGGDEPERLGGTGAGRAGGSGGDHDDRERAAQREQHLRPSQGFARGYVRRRRGGSPTSE